MIRLLPLVAIVALATTAFIPAAPNARPAAKQTITWKKTVLDKHFRAEGVAVADVNKDGKIDVLNGEYWYEAPDWKPHEMKPYTDYKDGLRNYSHSFACWADDFNGDGYPDLIVIDFPGDPCFWLENPQGKEGHWKKHIIWHSACNETPVYADLFGTGKRVLVMAWQPKGKETEGQMAYFTPGKDPTALWEMHPISEPSTPPEVMDGKPVPDTGKEIPGTRKFSHGLGVGDVNGDGKLDVLTSGATTGGVGAWWEQPSNPDGKTPWKMHPLQAPDACADMFAYDMDGDGKADILSTSAHRFGIWWHKQRPGKDGEPSFQKMEIFPKLVSETHAAHFKDIDGDGRPDLITGKRWWSHGRAEPGSDGPAAIYWLKNTKGPDGLVKFAPMLIDDDSGIGTQFEVADINGDGLLDVITSNKKGVRVIVQERK